MEQKELKQYRHIMGEYLAILREKKYPAHKIGQFNNTRFCKESRLPNSVKWSIENGLMNYTVDSFIKYLKQLDIDLLNLIKTTTQNGH